MSRLQTYADILLNLPVDDAYLYWDCGIHGSCIARRWS